MNVVVWNKTSICFIYLATDSVGLHVRSVLTSLFMYHSKTPQRHVTVQAEQMCYWSSRRDSPGGAVIGRCARSRRHYIVRYKFPALIWQLRGDPRYCRTALRMAQACLEFLGRWVSRQPERAPAARTTRRQVLHGGAEQYQLLQTTVTSHNFVRVLAERNHPRTGTCRMHSCQLNTSIHFMA